MYGVVLVILSRGLRHIVLDVDACFSRNHAYNNARIQKYAGDPERYIMKLVILLMRINVPSV